VSLENSFDRSDLAHLPTLKLVSENESDGLSLNLLLEFIKKLKTEFQKRFSDFRIYENELILLNSPFSINVNHVSEELKWRLLNCSATLS
jgi:hypothetical protein